MTHIHSYPSIYAIGHKAIAEIFSGPVTIEEKVDGSQFSFSLENGELSCRSKGAQLVTDAPEKMFERAVEVARSLPLHEGWVYRAEYLQKPKHNTLRYSRIPKDHLIIFDVCTGLEQYMCYADKKAEAARLGLETVPVLFEGMVTDYDMFATLLRRESVLGGCDIEGVVVKNYALFTADKKAMMGKYVSEAFKEVHGADWKERNPGRGDVIQDLIARYHTDARWNKAVQHLREAGKLEGSPRDIGLIMKEIPADVLKECEGEIRDILFKYFWDDIRRGITAGLPEWYKAELAKSAFEVK